MSQLGGRRVGSGRAAGALWPNVPAVGRARGAAEFALARGAKLAVAAGVARILRPSDVASRDTVALARRLLGCRLTVCADGAARSWRITEVEAYDGPDDKACHASRGRTARTAVLFGPPGRWYVYLCYGIHEMLNLVTGPEGYPAAVLIRGVAGVAGPGRVTRALGIDRRFNGRPATRATGLWIEDDGCVAEPAAIRAGPRIGVDYAGPVWAAKPWRFIHQPPADA